MTAEVKETGIIMSGNHPRDILEGRKTMTRRTYGLEIINLRPEAWHVVWNEGDLWAFSNEEEEDALTLKCPYGQVGDLLRVKETWAVCSFSANFAETSQLQIAYRAGVTVANPHPDAMTHSLEWRTVDYETWQKYACQKYYSWQPSLFMPKAFARIWRPITGLRAERLQEITEEDALAEGVDFINKLGYAGWRDYSSDWNEEIINVAPRVATAIDSFTSLWDSLNAKRGYSWDFNPWVWPISFKEVKSGGKGN